MFDYDWFHGPAFREQIEQSRYRCALKKFPDITPQQAETSEEFRRFLSELEVRILIYLRDGFSYEVKEIVESPTKRHFTFECEPVDEQYKVGSFVVSVPYDEIVRVEVFSVHPTEKPEDMPIITGFRAPPPEGPPRDDVRHRPGTREPRDASESRRR